MSVIYWIGPTSKQVQKEGNVLSRLQTACNFEDKDAFFNVIISFFPNVYYIYAQ